ncbi:hypothetical protein BLOT_003412 [Blomia tropicalis]|nr:hypothetical protein BLOT_003412 [Blomia tropicalis]
MRVKQNSIESEGYEIITTIDKRQNGVRRFDVLKSSNCDQMNYQLYYFDEIGPNLKSKSIDDKSILSINEIMCQAKIYVPRVSGLV